MAHAGDTVIVMNGTYDNEGQVATSSGGGMVVTVTNSGSPGNPITIMAQNRGGAILNSANTTSSSTGSYACNAAWSYFDLSYTSYVVIQGFVLENSCINGVRANGSAHDITLRWNEIRNVGNWNNPATTLSPTGIYTNSSEYNFVLDGNIFHDIGGGTNVNQQHAIYSSASNVTIVNNVFYNQVHGWDITEAGGKNYYIANNTFAYPNPNRAGHIILWDDSIANSLSNITIEDNIFYEPSSYAVVAELDAGGSMSGCVMQSNLITGASLFDNGSTFGSGGVSCSQSNNMTSDPMFVNPSGYDFHLQAGSPAIDSGTNNSFTAVDFEGWARPVNNIYDRGSYEYHAAAPPPPAVSISLTPNPGSVSVNQGSTASASIAATISGSATFAFSASGLPSGVSASFSPSSCSSSCNASVTFSASSSAQGSSNVTITGTSGSVSGTAGMSVSVNATVQPPAPPPPPSGPDYTSGLVAEWKLNGNATDSAGGDNGTLHGGVTWVNGILHGSTFKTLSLNGGNAYVSAGETPNLEMSNQMTISMWVMKRTVSRRFSTVAADAPRLFAKVYDWDIKLNSAMPQLSAGGSYALANTTIPLGVWTHLVFTFSQGEVTAYINGQPVGLADNTFTSGQTLPTTYNYGAYLGTDSSLAEFFPGDISDVRLYNRALQPSDVWALYSQVAP